MRSVSLGIITVPTPGTPVNIGSTVATVVGTEVGTYAIVLNTNDKLLLNVDGGADQTVTLTAGAARTATQVVSDINGQTSGITAFVSGGKVALKSNTSGNDSSLSIQAVTHAANTTLGFSVGTTDGADNIVCTKIRLIALKGNAGDVYVGNSSGFDKTVGTGLLDRIMKPLTTPDSLDDFEVESHDVNTLNTKEYFIDVDTANDGVMASIWVA